MLIGDVFAGFRFDIEKTPFGAGDMECWSVGELGQKQPSIAPMPQCSNAPQNYWVCVSYFSISSA
jgi:hypothetical protein